jgi:hypothetical protein
MIAIKSHMFIFFIFLEVNNASQVVTISLSHSVSQSLMFLHQYLLSNQT